MYSLQQRGEMTETFKSMKGLKKVLDSIFNLEQGSKTCGNQLKLAESLKLALQIILFTEKLVHAWKRLPAKPMIQPTKGG